MGWPGPMTHRQYLVWHEWLKAQWNIPNRGDHYLMQLTAVTSQKKEATVEEFAIVFKEPVPLPPAASCNGVILPPELPAVAQDGTTFKIKLPKRMTKEDIQRAEILERVAKVNKYKGQLPQQELVHKRVR